MMCKLSAAIVSPQAQHLSHRFTHPLHSSESFFGFVNSWFFTRIPNRNALLVEQAQVSAQDFKQRVDSQAKIEQERKVVNPRELNLVASTKALRYFSAHCWE